MVQDLSYNLCESLVENIGGVAGIDKKIPPTPITYLTQWKIVGNSEVRDNEIWSCGEYNPIDGKYHILVQPQGGSIADIALDAPLRKVNSVADTIEFPSDTEGKALVTRSLSRLNLGNLDYVSIATLEGGEYRYFGDVNAYNVKQPFTADNLSNILCAYYPTITGMQVASGVKGIAITATGGKRVSIFDPDFKDSYMSEQLKRYLQGVELIYELDTPTTELVDAPQIQEADSYSMIISQGSKAVEWSSFESE